MRSVVATVAMAIALTAAQVGGSAEEPPSNKPINREEKENVITSFIHNDSSLDTFGIVDYRDMGANTWSKISVKEDGGGEGEGGQGREVLPREKPRDIKPIPKPTITTTNNGYAYGNCTYYVKSQKPQVPNGYGDAKNWPVNSDTPAEGSIIVTYESWRGHVGIVREINGTQIKIEEMNYIGYNRVSTRVVDYRTLPLKGFLVI